MTHICITSDLQVSETEMKFSFSTSPGPGGQNVNRVNTRAELRFNVRTSKALDSTQRNRLLVSLESFLSSEGILIIRSSRYRSQWRNREDCVERFMQKIAAGLQSPPPPRKTSRRGKTAHARRIQKKRNQSLKKALRRRPSL